RAEDAVDAAVLPERVRPRRAENGAAARQDARDLLRPERLEQPLDEPSPTLAHADDLVSLRPGPACHGADDGVQPGAVAAARENRNAHEAPPYPIVLEALLA